LPKQQVERIARFYAQKRKEGQWGEKEAFLTGEGKDGVKEREMLDFSAAS